MIINILPSSVCHSIQPSITILTLVTKVHNHPNTNIVYWLLVTVDWSDPYMADLIIYIKDCRLLCSIHEMYT